LHNHGNYIRNNFNHYHCFTADWCRRYPGAWFAVGWAAGYAWRAATWPALVSYVGYPAEPIYWDYGTNVVYEGDTVYIDGDVGGTAQQYVQEATSLAATGRAAQVSKEEEWMPLGVFAMVQGEEKTSTHIFQLALNKQGIIRGTYYDAVADKSETVYGSVNKKTQLAAWTVGERKTPLYEAGIANLTREETPLLVKYEGGNTQQWILVRIEQPEEKKE
jgi:hypothetical protein